MEDVKAKVDLSKLMAATMMEILRIMWQMAMECMLEKKDSGLKASGRIMSRMGMGKQPIQMAPDMLGSS